MGFRRRGTGGREGGGYGLSSFSLWFLRSKSKMCHHLVSTSIYLPTRMNKTKTYLSRILSPDRARAGFPYLFHVVPLSPTSEVGFLKSENSTPFSS